MTPRAIGVAILGSLPPTPGGPVEKTQLQKDMAKMAEIAVGAVLVALLGGVFYGVVHVLM